MEVLRLSSKRRIDPYPPPLVSIEVFDGRMTNIVSFADGETDGFGIRDVRAHVVGATPVLLCNQRDYSGQGLACSAFVNSSSQADLKHYFAREQSIAVRVSQGKGAQRLERCWIDKRSQSRGRVDVVRRTR